MPQHVARLELPSPDHTCAFAHALAPLLGAGDTILLAGEVGAGKTHFARCLIQARLDEPEDIPSPTFTLVQTYEPRGCEIWHADLYRLTDISEVEELGLAQAFSDAICLVEWPDRLDGNVPADALTLTLEAPSGDDKRLATLRWDHPSWDDKLEKVLND